MNLFVKDTLHIGVRRQENKVIVEISSDYVNSNHKGQLYINEDRIGEQLLSEWKRFKTTKLKKIRIYFDEIDWYDDEVDVYETPIVQMERGLRKCKFGTRSHGSIPKDWSVIVTMVFEDLQTKKPIKDCISVLLGSMFDITLQKKFDKECNPVIQGKKEYSSISNY